MDPSHLPWARQAKTHDAIPRAVSKPVLLKLGGSVLTDKRKEESLQRTVARRLINEVAKAEVPVVLFHGAGGYGHPQAAKWKLGHEVVTPERRAGVAHTLATVGLLHAEVVRLADDAGLRPVSVPLHALVESDAGTLMDLPIGRIQRLLEEGFTPVLCGTLVRDDQFGWRIVSADEVMQELAQDLAPRLAVFVTDVDGVYEDGPDRGEPIAHLTDIAQLRDGKNTNGTDVTGGMEGKVHAAMTIAEACPVLFVNGKVRGRLLDALKGKQVVCTRVE